MKFICANANLIQGVNLDTDYDYFTFKAKTIAFAVESLANSFSNSKSDCVLFVWNTDNPDELVRATEQASLENINFKKIIDELLVDYRLLGDYDFESIELEDGTIISVVKYVTMNNLKESKKSARKSLKESKKWVSDVADDLFISFEDILNVFEEYGYGKKEAQDFYDSKWDDVDDMFDIMPELAVLFELECWEESKKSARKSIKESNDDNWYKLKVLNEMLDAMAKDEYNIPKVGIYGVTKNINLDEGAIKELIKYYK